MTLENGHISFRCIELHQPIGSFYVGVIDALDLIEISWSDVQRIERRDVETFLGIERPLSPDRVAELERYVHTLDASFPTGIIVAVSDDNADFDPNSGMMTLTRAPNVAQVIDGQHRLEGLKALATRGFELNVTVFVDMDVEDQAMVFATINLKQTRVSKSLAYNLYEYATSRSPQKTCHDIAKLLNGKDGSPFEDRIKILGRATPGKSAETLTQAGFVDRLLPLISSDPENDRDLLRRDRQPVRADATNPGNLVFRNMFLEKLDAEIARVTWNYFAAVSRRWPSAWNTSEVGLVLNRTTGFAALMRLLPFAYLRLGKPGDIVGTDAFHTLFARSELGDADFTSNRFLPGSTGQGLLYTTLMDQIGLGG